jgi:ribose transport system substrate-binding protein
VTLGFSHPFAEVPIVTLVDNLVTAKGKAIGWNVLLDQTRSGNLQSQTSTVDTWITQHVTAINLLPADPTALETTAQRAIDAGIIWTTYAVKMKQGAGGVLFPPELSGQVTGQAVVDYINKNDPNAKVLILTQLPGESSQAPRVEIPKQMIQSQTHATIVAEQPAIDQPTGLRVTADVLQAHPDVSVVVALNDDGAMGAAAAFKQAGKDVNKSWIIGQDGSLPALQAIKQGGFLKASAALDIGKLTTDVIDITKKAIDSHWKPGDPQNYVSLAPTLVTQDDTATLDRLLASYQS